MTTMKLLNINHCLNYWQILQRDLSRIVLQFIGKGELIH